LPTVVKRHKNVKTIPSGISRHKSRPESNSGDNDVFDKLLNKYSKSLSVIEKKSVVEFG
jgi:hypothetical protein